MNQAHLHLVVNHLPILGVLFGLLTLTGGYFFRNNSVKRTALGLFLVSAIFAIPAYLSGEGAEEIVEKLPGASDPLMETHEELANIFLWLVMGLGLTALLTLFLDFKEKKMASSVYLLTFALALTTMVFAQKVGASGGEIRHTEIRNGVTALEGANAKNSPEKDDD